MTPTIISVLDIGDTPFVFYNDIILQYETSFKEDFLSFAKRCLTLHYPGISLYNICKTYPTEELQQLILNEIPLLISPELTLAEIEPSLSIKNMTLC